MTESKKNKVEEVTEESQDGRIFNGDIFMAWSSFAKLTDKDFLIPDTINLRRLILKLSGHYKIIEVIRNGLIRKYGEGSLKGSGQLTIVGPNDPKGRPMTKTFPKYWEEFTELMSQEVKVDFEKVKLPSMIDSEPIKLSVVDLDRLEKFVEVA